MSKRGRLAYIREVLREYPQIKKRPAETWSERDARLVSMVDDTLAEIAQTRDGDKQASLFDLVYFRRSHTLYGAAMTIPVSERQAQKWNARLMRIMADKMQLF